MGQDKDKMGAAAESARYLLHMVNQVGAVFCYRRGSIMLGN